MSAGNGGELQGDRTSAFLRRFLLIVTALGVAGLGLVLLVSLLMPRLTYMAPALAGALLVAGGCHLLARRGRIREASYAFLALSVAIITVLSVQQALPTSISGAAVGYMFVGGFAAFLVPGWALAAYGLMSILAIAIVTWRTLDQGALPFDLAASAAVSGCLILTCALVILFVFARHYRQGVALLETRMEVLDRVMASARHVIDGDLATEVAGDDEASETVRLMLEALRRVVGAIRHQVAELTAAADDLSNMAQKLEATAAEQAAITAQVDRTLDDLEHGASRVAEAAEEVAEASASTEASSDRAVDQLAALSLLATQIDDLAGTIRDVASKSEVLALNAALEGVAAGEHGRGFSLVAAEMQRLAESVSLAARDVRDLTRDVEATTHRTVNATSAGRDQAAQAAAASRRILDVAMLQRERVAETAEAMAQVAEGAADTSLGSRQTLEASARLQKLAGTLEALVAGFELGSSTQR
ncbi:MAG: methyl-accepting chemotaxis protein [Polyangiaceae bacterium]